jgi:5-methylcytosine-specific restriction endonuclease McrBC GTP-binding regulatory subunit McrB
MNQEELIEWLKPKKFNPEVHIIIKAQFKGFCQLCSKSYMIGEFVTWNHEKKKARHINCEDPSLRNRSSFRRKPRMIKK